MDPITIAIVSAVAATGAEMLMKFLKPHAVKMIERLKESREQRKLQTSGARKHSSSSTQRESEQPAVTAHNQFERELERYKTESARRLCAIEGALPSGQRDQLHITFGTSALEHYRAELRAGLADDVRIVSMSGLGGRGKSSLLQNYLTYTNNQLTTSIAIFLYAQMLIIILKSATAVKAH
eukprot:21039-Heterococcus_DN1.PRE.1